MENNIYKTIQDWHDLLKNGVITEAEFIAKKNELLGKKEETATEVIEVAPETNENEDNFHSDYERNQEEDKEEGENFFSKYLLFIILGTICIVIFSFYHYTKKHTKTEVPLTEQTISETNIDTTETVNNDEDKVYWNSLKDFLKSEWKKPNNPNTFSDIKVISFTDEIDGLIIETTDGSIHYSFNTVFKGDLDNDGINEIILNSDLTGPGNNYSPEYFILRKNNSEEYNINFLSTPEEFPEGLSEAKTHMEWAHYIVDKIDNGFVYLSIGNPGHYYKDENGEDQLEEVIVKCKLTGNRLEVVN